MGWNNSYRPLRIVAPIDEPYTYPCVINMTDVGDTTQCPYPGIAAEILDAAIRSANLSYELIPFEAVDSWGKIIGQNSGTYFSIIE